MKTARLNKLIEMSRTPIMMQPPIDRDELGPMVTGYCTEMLKSCGFKDSLIADVSERLLAQMIRDCVYFYQFNRNILDPLYTLKEYSDKKCGIHFWRQRHNLPDAFTNQGFEEHWDTLAQSCKRFAPIDADIYEINGVIDWASEEVWEW